jgi:glycosyltransferase involved in cell wall biosynthesis
MKPLVSIVIPIYNEEKYLRECIESILRQTYTNWELIIVNDESTDKTVEIVEYFLINYPQKIALLNVKRQGDGACMNRGLEISKGKYIARMDGDDIMLPLRIEKQVSFLEENPRIGAMGASAYLINELGERIGERRNPVDNNTIKQLIDECKYPIIHPTLMIRREVLAEIRYREILMAAVDLSLWIDLAPKTELANLDEFLLKKRIHNTSMTGNLDRSKIVAFNTQNIIINHFLSKKDYLKVAKALIRQIKLLLIPNVVSKWRIMIK